MSWNNIHPGLVMFFFGILIFIFPERWRKYLMIVGSACSLIAFEMLGDHSALPVKITDTITLKLIDPDGVSMTFCMVFCTIAVINAVYSMDLHTKWEAGVTCFYVGSNMGIVLSGDLISFIAFWEMSAFASTYIIYARHRRKSSRAAFRYLLVHAFGGNMLLAGVILQIFHSGTEVVNIADVQGGAFWLMLIGVAVNAAVPPFTGWIADAYPEATIPGTVYLGSYTTKAAIYAMITFFSGTYMLIYVGAFMAIFAACMALLENDIRRLLSYHIVSQLGMMVASLGVGSEIGIDGASAHAITNIFFKGVLLMCAGAIIQATGTAKITELGGLRKKMPITSTCFLISSLAIAGFPFLSGFASKALIMESLHGYGDGLPALLVTIAGVGTLLSITLKINYFVFFGKPTGEEVKIRNTTFSMVVAIMMGTVMSIVIGLDPDLLYQRLTYHSSVDPFTLPHIMEYVAIILGGSVPFFITLRIMKPHDEISIDFDWFYRRPLVKLVHRISVGIYGIFAWFDKNLLQSVQYFGTRLGDPYQWTRRSGNLRVKSMSFENEDRLIGSVIEGILAVFLILIACAICMVR